jgi:integrase
LQEARTLRSVAEEYLTVKQGELRPESFRVTRLYLTGPYFKPLHAAAMTQITLADVAGRISAIARTNGSVTAGRARSALSTLYRWAIGEGLLGTQPVNPVIGTNLAQGATPRERVLNDAETVAIWRACADDDFGRIVKLLALTGCRREEIGGLRWSEIDLANRVVTLPAVRVKNKRSFILPLAPLALSVIETAPRLVDRDHVFGSRSSAGFTDWAGAKHSLDERLAGKITKEWRLHDLRRTLAMRMADLGVQPHIIEAVLNHVSGHKAGVAGIYNRSLYEREVRNALALWADHVSSIVEGRARKVLPMRKQA